MSKTLAFNHIDTYELELEDGYLQCDLFLDEGIVRVTCSDWPIYVNITLQNHAKAA
jgi:hypothetical protein